MNSQLKDSLAGTIFTKIICRGEVGSTNDLALSMLDGGEDGAIAVSADSQSSGRGRLGRSWYSPPSGNIYLSIMMRLDIPLRDASLFTLISGVAACTGIRKSTRCDVHIKWPNDIVFNEKKLGGILTETRVEGDLVTGIVTGIGINVNMLKAEFPEELQGIATSLLAETGESYDRREAAVAILKQFDVLFRDVFPQYRNNKIREIDLSGKEKLVYLWKSLDITLGKRISVKTPNETVNGMAVDIGPAGQLLVMSDSGEKISIHAGDVTVLNGYSA
ncbi:MAG TPA: biotin--[acetyl-CoA-carboxylase] ligase [Nitrospirae bacterium]|nr:biotin--[acetyl-CoA-carboxylase] ligase [Nitrospirota bacterium]